MAPRADVPGAAVDGDRGHAAVAPSDVLTDALLAGRVVVLDGFLAQPRVRALIDCAHRRRNEGEFRPAQIGTERRSMRREDVRGDLTCWLTEALFPEERLLFRDLERMRQDINRDTFLGLFDLEIHYAWYPPGAGYARHVDRPLGRNQRVVTVILYLNEAWQPGTGGELRVFVPRGQRDIEPVAGRLVCFLSDGLEHAVLPTQTDRLSVTGWFLRRDSA